MREGHWLRITEEKGGRTRAHKHIDDRDGEDGGEDESAEGGSVEHFVVERSARRKGMWVKGKKQTRGKTATSFRSVAVVGLNDGRRDVFLGHGLWSGE